MTEALEPRTPQASAEPVKESFARTLWRVVVSPRPAMSDLGRDPAAGRKGVYLLIIVSVVYTLIDWLTGVGTWLPLAYQLIGLLWIAALLVDAVRASLARGGPAVATTTVVAAVIYALPVGLLIR